MSAGIWIKCVKTITEIFIEGKFYRSSLYRDGTYITVIDELGNGIGFDVVKDSEFKDHFKFAVSQKRGTKWDISRRQSDLDFYVFEKLYLVFVMLNTEKERSISLRLKDA